jgi:hypothetical protein
MSLESACCATFPLFISVIPRVVALLFRYLVLPLVNPRAFAPSKPFQRACLFFAIFKNHFFAFIIVHFLDEVYSKLEDELDEMQCKLDAGVYSCFRQPTNRQDLTCFKCGKNDFGNHQHNYELHVRVCKVKRAFLCEHCNRDFGNNQVNYERHVRSGKCLSVRGYFAVTCPKCGAKYADKKACEEHLETCK